LKRRIARLALKVKSGSVRLPEISVPATTATQCHAPSHNDRCQHYENSQLHIACRTRQARAIWALKFSIIFRSYFATRQRLRENLPMPRSLPRGSHQANTLSVDTPSLKWVAATQEKRGRHLWRVASSCFHERTLMLRFFFSPLTLISKTARPWSC